MTLDELREIKRRRDELIHESVLLRGQLVAGLRELHGTVPMAELIYATGLSRPRIYQLLDRGDKERPTKP